MTKEQTGTIAEAARVANRVLDNPLLYTKVTRTLAGFIITLLAVIQIQEDEIEHLSYELIEESPE